MSVQISCQLKTFNRGKMFSLRNAILFTVFIYSFSLGANGKRQCSFSGISVAPCRCYYNQIYCRGNQIDENSVENLFRNLSSKLPVYMQHVKSFELFDSKVKYITPKIFANINVKSSLKLRNNKLANFSIGNFDQLYMLDISNNEFLKLNLDAFIGLKQLQVLHAANIGLGTLKKEYFSHLKNLKRLDLSGNEIDLVESDSFTSEYDNNFELNQIDLSYNRIRRLPKNIFLVLRQPERIDLSGNCLESVDEIFRFSRDIVQYDPIEIVLSNNSLTVDHFSNRTFGDLVARGHYVMLDLSYNKLSWLDESVFGKLMQHDSRSVLKLNHNPMQCTNCRNRWLLQQANERPNFFKSINLPRCLEGQLFSAMKLTDFAHCN